jgi:hypothetical protein
MLKKWSAAGNWQDRVDAHVAETNRKVLAKLQTDVAGERVRALRRIRQQLDAIERQSRKDDYKPDSKELTKLQEQAFQLLGFPLPKRTELTGKDGEDIAERIRVSHAFDAITEDEESARLAADLTGRLSAARAARGGTDRGGSGQGDADGAGLPPDELATEEPASPDASEQEAD